jgi:hypothetical protein
VLGGVHGSHSTGGSWPDTSRFLTGPVTCFATESPSDGRRPTAPRPPRGFEPLTSAVQSQSNVCRCLSHSAKDTHELASFCFRWSVLVSPDAVTYRFHCCHAAATRYLHLAGLVMRMRRTFMRRGMLRE